MPPVLGYWNIRGLGQPIRLLLAHTETPFEDKKYAFGPAPDFDRSAWLKEKFSLGLDFPNLPYYIDGDVRLTQSTAILRYLARKFNLEGESEEEKLKADVIEQQITDVGNNFYGLAYHPEFETLKEEFLKNLPAVLKPISNFLGKRQWFASQEKLTYVDFLVYEALDCHKILAPSCLNDFQNLREFMERFEGLPTICKYMQSTDFLKYPLCGDDGVFGSRSYRK